MSELKLYVDGVEMDGVVAVADILKWVDAEYATVRLARRSLVESLLRSTFDRDVQIKEEDTVLAALGMEIKRVDTFSLQEERAVITDIYVDPFNTPRFTYIRTDPSLAGTKLTWADGNPWYDVNTGHKVVLKEEE